MNISSKSKNKIALFLLCAVVCCVIAFALISVVAAIQRPSTTHFLTTFGLGAGVYVWFDILLSEAKFQGWKEGYRESSDKWQKWKEEDNETWSLALQESSNRWRNLCEELVERMNNNERK